MADPTIQEGGEVSWNYGQGQPTGDVAEIQTEGNLEIESRGKKIHKTASPSNPAVHVARNGNDVIKRVNELMKVSEGAAGEEGMAADVENEESRDRMNQDKEVEIGKKRERDEGAEGGEEDVAEEEGVKETKKQKEDEHEGEELPEEAPVGKGAKKGGRTRKSAKKSSAVGTSTEKKRGPGRPKKTSTASATAMEGIGQSVDQKMAVDEVVVVVSVEEKMDLQREKPVAAGGDVPAAHTRSKN